MQPSSVFMKEVMKIWRGPRKIGCPYLPNVVLLALILAANFGCKNNAETSPSKYNYIKPQYDQVGLNSSADTMTFALGESTYTDIKSFNLFVQNDTEYISFYDQRSQTINIYNFQSQQQVKKIKLKRTFSSAQLFKTTVFTRNFDSILVNNQATFYQLDSKGKINKTIAFLKNPPLSWAVFQSTSLPVFKGSQIYALVRPYVKERSLKALKEWRVLYRFDLQNEKANLIYNLPEIYQKYIYGFHFLDYNYCYNDHGNFVFSFPADSNIYETNLENYHIAYYGRSQFQNGPIQPASEQDISKSDDEYRNFLKKDSYGPIYFDPYMKRYLRVSRSGIRNTDLEAKNWRQQERLIIFDDGFKIIGESKVDDEILLNTIFFTRDGNIFARTRSNDEYALHFVRMKYEENIKLPLTKK